MNINEDGLIEDWSIFECKRFLAKHVKTVLSTLIRYCYFKINNYLCIGKWNNEKPTVTNATIEFVSPIPITEELLLKNGFMKIRGGLLPTCYYKKVGDCFAEIEFGCSSMGKDYVICHIDNCDRNSVASANIQHVHQLQNLLNIMNIKFDIEL